MKKIMSIIFVLALFGVSCGGSDSNPPTPDQKKVFEDSMDAMNSLMDDEIIECVLTGALECPCSGGGKVVVSENDENSISLKFESCKGPEDETYTGTIVVETETSVGNGTMSVFGQCTDITAVNFNADDCEGSLNGDCDGSFSCTLNGTVGSECVCE